MRKQVGHKAVGLGQFCAQKAPLCDRSEALKAVDRENSEGLSF